MHTFRLVLKPLTAFGTPLAGDTLFGQLCWMLRHLYGKARLMQLLEGYTNGHPFMVMSDAFPSGFIPLPALPPMQWEKEDKPDRKALKKKRWLALSALEYPAASWQRLAKNDQEAAQFFQADGLVTEHLQPHNSINRHTGTTDSGQFSPYIQNQLWYHPGITLDLYLVIDEDRLSLDEFKQALQTIGLTGYGRDASIGLGKFEILMLEPHQWPCPKGARDLLTLAACAPQGLGFAAERSFYHVQTRFGRHGDIAAVNTNPFKQPLLMARSGAVLGYPDNHIPTVMPVLAGQGIGQVSRSQPEAVHQGYAPAVAILVEHVA